MKKHHDKAARADRVAEPVQVYLDRSDRERLARLVEQLGANKSEVLRRGLAALESLTRRPAGERRKAPKLPSFKGKGLQEGVDLDDMGSLLDVMGDAAR